MHLRGLKPNGTVISSVLPAVGDLEDLILGSQIQWYVIKMGMESGKCIVAPLSICRLFGKCGCSSHMLQVFDEMDALDIGACSAFVSGLLRNGFVDEARMGTTLVSASSATMVEGIAALQALRWARSKNCRRVHILTDASVLLASLSLMLDVAKNKALCEMLMLDVDKEKALYEMKMTSNADTEKRTVVANIED
ncbi:hypothetical protein RHGRI_038869 [Rhododendron griersonianum]|uniref:RNase H type-1 domain-containing protein n=1 Tax=Rhododendron griersonianum TaxID=479676 RepID=A0AAV6HLK8_9ERIC|nr:hypothetical protein RHGRI_038869 [Rhododendron griersonianum]